jgi:sensor histidine kinase YesM
MFKNGFKMNDAQRKIKSIDYIVIGFVFMIMFLMPVFFTRMNGEISWRHVIKLWTDMVLLFPVYIVNHWLLVPRLMFKKKYIYYAVSITMLIAGMTLLYYMFDNVWTGTKHMQSFINRPTPIPPYAHLLMYSMMIAGIDTGLMTMRKWHENEENKQILERRNAEMRLNILKSQVSPHFLMNTLNNLYAFIDEDPHKAKTIVMKLSKIMRYMLYESGSGKVPLSKEFEFVESYVNLMKMRFDDKVIINFSLPEVYDDVGIPPLLFISFIENAFKYGVSYEKRSTIDISFKILNNKLIFYNYNNCCSSASSGTGIGISNTLERLRLIYEDRYNIEIKSQDNTYTVTLLIPLS